MTRLLVSVRDQSEARAALDGGAGVIDVKEPRHGSLGAASRETIAAVLREVDGLRPVSAALGELIDADRQFVASLPEGLAFAKLGLAACAALDDWQARWRRMIEALPHSIAPVAVAYADHQLARSPAPLDVLAASAATQCKLLLVDTFDKTRGGLLDQMAFKQLDELIVAARAQGMQIVLAGSLDASAIAKVAALAPDFIAVRGAACEQGRTSTISPRRVRALAELLSQRCEPEGKAESISAADCCEWTSRSR